MLVERSGGGGLGRGCEAGVKSKILRIINVTDKNNTGFGFTE